MNCATFTPVNAPDGEAVGWHYATGLPTLIEWKRGVFTRFSSAAHLDPEAPWLAPALTDLQVNGYAGVDFQRDDASLEQLLFAARQIQNDGCGRFLLTLITDKWERLIARLRRFRELRESSPELSFALAGWHIEGPFLSSEPGFHGAHNPAWMRDPTAEQINELRAVTGSDPVLLTMAPERTGALAAIEWAVSLGMTVSLGHTNASHDLLQLAVRAGATGFTHLGNGCPSTLDRHDNILWRVFETPGLTVSLIPDQIHVSPALFRLIHQTLGADRIYYTTDAMAAAGAPPGRYSLGELVVDVGNDQIVRQPGKPNFAGSALRPITGVLRAAQMLGRSWREVWDASSARPARLVGFPRLELEVGQPACFCALEPLGPESQ